MHVWILSASLCFKPLRVGSTGSEEELGSSEESGKDWDELEEEAKKGLLSFVHSRPLIITS